MLNIPNPTNTDHHDDDARGTNHIRRGSSELAIMQNNPGIRSVLANYNLFDAWKITDRSARSHCG
jgi:hypothetical protein